VLSGADAGDATATRDVECVAVALVVVNVRD